MFEFLFRYPFAAFSRGHVVLLGPGPAWLLVALIALGGLLLALLIRARARRSTARLGKRRLGVLWLLQWLTAAVLLVLLWRPALSVSELTPRQNIVAVLVDDSRSMGAVEDGSTREEQATRALGSGVLDTLQRSFQTRLYRFNTGITRVPALAAYGPANARATHIGASLAQLLTQTADLPLGAILLLSDGGDNAGGIDRSVIEALRNRRIPVYTVGFGAESPGRDVEIEDVVLASRTLAGSRLSATVKFQQHGLAGHRSTLTVRDGSRVLASREVGFAPDGRIQTQELQFDVGPAGARSVQFAIEPLPEESNRANNSLTRLVYAQPQPRRILYFEGEPRWEYKFIRRAAADDRMIQLVSMLRTTENKIYRQGISNPQELAGGFPSRAEDLFGYQALIIGSVDAGYFTSAQQRLIREFVDRRGGGLLLLGGRSSLADGVWGGSQVADLLPVVLPEGRQTFHRDPATVSLTPAGEDSVICRLLDDPAANVQRWRTLPYLMDYQDPGRPKPGATVLAQMHVAGRTMPLLVTENYGRGRTAVLATGGTWRWQMSLPLGDRSHDLFWQQLLRWLVADSHGPVTASIPARTLYDDSHTRLDAEVRDPQYQLASDMTVSAHVIGPGGVSAQLELNPVPNAPGQYEADVSAPAPGVYVAELSAHRAGQEVGRDMATFQRVDGVAESFHTEQNRALLEALAGSTGGRYLRPRELAGLPAQIPYSRAGISVQQIRDLWNMPVVFLLILLLRCGEWLVRRTWGIV